MKGILAKKEKKSRPACAKLGALAHGEILSFPSPKQLKNLENYSRTISTFIQLPASTLIKSARAKILPTNA